MSDTKKQKRIEDLTLGEVKQMCEINSCGNCIFALSCLELFKGMPSHWNKFHLSTEIHEDE